MLSLTRKTDYAIIALCHLASLEGRQVSNVREIALQYDLPAELLAKAMQRLAREGLLTSHAGPTGGYALARDSAEISVADVVLALEGPLRIASCFDDDSPNACAAFDKCTLRDPIKRLQKRLFELLDGISLAEMSQPPVGVE
ncbi:MAG: RrF2 family transcriptional regulator [Nitrospinota bacterium]